MSPARMKEPGCPRVQPDAKGSSVQDREVLCGRNGACESKGMEARSLHGLYKKEHTLRCTTVCDIFILYKAK